MYDMQMLICHNKPQKGKKQERDVGKSHARPGLTSRNWHSIVSKKISVEHKENKRDKDKPLAY